MLYEVITEVRFPDPACNGYLAFSALMMAGLDGIENKIDPGQPVDKDLYGLAPEELKEIPSVAGSLTEALEALIRWNHPTQGCLPASRFIPLAEDSGLILPIGEWVLRTACTQAVAWQRAGIHPMRMAVNISARQLARPDFIDMWLDYKRESYNFV